MGNSQIVASRHYLQLRDEHFDRASSEIVASSQGDHSDHVGTKTDSVGQIVGLPSCETTKPPDPVKAKNPEKLKVLRGSAGFFGSLREQLMGAEGLEPPTPSV